MRRFSSQQKQKTVERWKRQQGKSGNFLCQVGEKRKGGNSVRLIDFIIHYSEPFLFHPHHKRVVSWISLSSFSPDDDFETLYFPANLCVVLLMARAQKKLMNRAGAVRWSHIVSGWERDLTIRC